MRPRIRAVTLGLLLALAGACSVDPPLAPDAEPAPEAPAPGTEPVAGGGGGGEARVGQFSGLAGHRASGGVRFTVAGDVGTIEFESNFSSTRVPDPYVYVNSGQDANRGTPLRIARLDTPTGAQTYTFRIPSGVAYTYVLVWCDRYNVGVGAASLN